ncbi:hypothetical protein IQ225_17690, partial [Synechocystis salina LEGE 06155]|nr:hypothetical protein [Synechocystis salina LEGE 06155]
KAVDDFASFSINRTTGEVTLINNPDFEAKSSYAFTITASDGVNPVVEQGINLAINDLDESVTNINQINGDNAGNFLFGTTNNDLIQGFGGNDILLGNGGNDTLYGGEGNDNLLGGFDDDVLMGGRGADRLIGGLGRDKFVYNALNEAGDIIFDFNRNQDQLILTELFKDLGYNGINPIADGYLRFNRLGFGTQVQIDPDGVLNGLNYTTLTTLIGILPSSLSVGTNVVI